MVISDESFTKMVDTGPLRTYVFRALKRFELLFLWAGVVFIMVNGPPNLKMYFPQWAGR